MRLRLVAGKVVPLVLLAYGIPSYMSTYAYAQQLRRTRSDLFVDCLVVYFNLLLFVVVASYLRIYLAYVPHRSLVRTSTMRGKTGLPDSRRAWIMWTLETFFPLRLRDELPQVPDEAEFSRIRKSMVHQCGPDGQLMRCWRDECRGHFKPARTRHCGDCRTCRPGWDHHCPVFAQDIVAKHTMASFFVFLFSSMLLLISLFPLTWQMTVDNSRAIIHFAWYDPSMRLRWWDMRWPWIGGPNLRYIGALIHARRQLNLRSQDTGREYALMPLFVLTGAFGLISIAVALAWTSLSDALRGDRAVDRNRSKMWRGMAQRPRLVAPEPEGTAMSTGLQQQDPKKPIRMKSQHGKKHSYASPPGASSQSEPASSPWLYFWVPISIFAPSVRCQAQQLIVEEGGVVVPIHELERPYGSEKPSLLNLFAAIDPYYAQQEHLQPAIPTRTRARLIQLAQQQFDQHQGL